MCACALICVFSHVVFATGLCALTYARPRARSHITLVCSHVRASDCGSSPIHLRFVLLNTVWGLSPG